MMTSHLKFEIWNLKFENSVVIMSQILKESVVPRFHIVNTPDFCLQTQLSKMTDRQALLLKYLRYLKMGKLQKFISKHSYAEGLYRICTCFGWQLINGWCKIFVYMIGPYLSNVWIKYISICDLIWTWINAPTKYINFSPKELMINVYLLLTRLWRDVMVTVKPSWSQMPILRE